MTGDYLFGRKRLHWMVFGLLLAAAAFMRWYRLDSCTMCSQDEWLTIDPTFLFLQKVKDHGLIPAVGFEALAAFPFLDVGRSGPPFDYTRSFMLPFNMPYYYLVGLFDFPISEAWFRFPATLWGLAALPATYFFVYQLTERHVAALFAFGMQATLLAHVITTRMMIADIYFPLWYALAAGLWIKFARGGAPRVRAWAYLASTLFAAATPDAYFGLASIAMLVVLLLWQEGRITFHNLRQMLAELKRVFVARSAWWLVGFYAFNVLVEIKLYFHRRELFLNAGNYLGRVVGRGTGEIALFWDRLIDWYFYPNISLALMAAALASLLLICRRGWRAALIYGWFWTLLWLGFTLVINNSSTNFLRIMHPMLVLGSLGFLAVYDRHPSWGAVFSAGLIAANVAAVYLYPLLCPLPADQNVAQAVGYLVQEHNEEWGGAAAIGFYFPRQGLRAYMPDDSFTPISFRHVHYLDCGLDLLTENMGRMKVIFAFPDDYDTRQQITRLLDFAIQHDCVRRQNQIVNAYARTHGFALVGRLVSRDGQVHINIWSTLPLELGDISIETANRLQYERYSREAWFKS